MNETQVDQLRRALRREAQDIHPVGVGAATVRRRGRRRRNRGRAAVAVGAATCVAGLGVSLMERGGAGTPHRVAVAAQAPTNATPSLEFRVVDGTVSNAFAHFTTSGGVTYVLSTAPGTTAQDAQPAQAIYRTSDGEHWSSVDLNRSVSDLTGRDGVLYAIGTAPGAAADEVQYRMTTSHDDGADWSETDLPFDLSAPNATVPTTRSSSVQFAAGPTATLALLTESFSPNLDALVAARTAGHPNVTTRQAADGYQIVDMSGCVAAKGSAVASGSSTTVGEAPRIAASCQNPPVLGTITWSDIGVSGPGDLFRQQGLLSTDGTHWDSVPLPAGGTVRDLTADGNGFVAVADNAPLDGTPSPVTTTVLQSADGRTWTRLGAPAGLSVQAIAGGMILATDGSGALQTSTDGGTTWNQTGIGSLVPGVPNPSVIAADAGPLGLAALVMDTSTPTPGHDYLLFSSDGIDWKTTDLTKLGEPSGSYPAELTVGADHVGVDFETAGATPGGPAKTTTVLGTPSR